MQVRTTKRNIVWAVQKKVGGRWATIVDGSGPIFIATRKLARNISRHYKTLNPRTARNYRVTKYIANG